MTQPSHAFKGYVKHVCTNGQLLDMIENARNHHSTDPNRNATVKQCKRICEEEMRRRYEAFLQDEARTEEANALWQAMARQLGLVQLQIAFAQ